MQGAVLLGRNVILPVFVCPHAACRWLKTLSVSLFWSLSINPFRTAAPFWGQTTHISRSLSLERDCDSKEVEKGPKRANSKLTFLIIVSPKTEPAVFVYVYEYYQYIVFIALRQCIVHLLFSLESTTF